MAVPRRLVYTFANPRHFKSKPFRGTAVLGTSELVGFAATTHPELAKAFYRDVLGLRLIEDGAFAIVFDANGTMLRIQKVEEHVPARHTALGWRVDDVRSKVDELVRKGVRFERYQPLPQDDRGIWRTPDGAEVAWFKDPDGNVLSLTQWPT
jgi:catechol 2,3-dioxygenase-like lactoylglutathione lyase family enzyme